jgi:hypothetical protein
MEDGIPVAASRAANAEYNDLFGGNKRACERSDLSEQFFLGIPPSSV